MSQTFKLPLNMLFKICHQNPWLTCVINMIKNIHCNICKNVAVNNDVIMEHNDEYSRKTEIKRGFKFNWASKQMILAIWKNVQLWSGCMKSHVDSKSKLHPGNISDIQCISTLKWAIFNVINSSNQGNPLWIWWR